MGTAEDGQQCSSEVDKRRDSPVDKAYAWIILIASASILTILVGFMKCTGIFFVEFQRRFHATASVTSLIDMFHNFAYSISAVLVSTVALKFFSNRRLVMFGGALHGFCFIITAVAKHIGVLYWFRGILNGISFGFIYPPVIAIIGVYFERHRGLANSIAMLGPCIGGLLFAPLVTRLFEEYLYTGAFLIIASMALNIVVCAALLRPLTRFEETESVKLEKDIQKTPELVETEPTQTDNDSSLKTDGRLLVSHKASSNVADSTDDSYIKLNVKNQRIHLLSHITRSQDLPTKYDIEVMHHTSGAIKKPSSMFTSERNLNKYPLELRSSIRSLIGDLLHKIDNSPPARLNSAEFLSQVPASDKNAFTELVPDKTIEQDNKIKTRKKTSTTCVACRSRVVNVLSMVFDPKLLKNPVFGVILFCAGLLSVGVVACIIFVPPLAKDLNIPADKIALLLSVNNLVDLCSRIIFGVISDRGWIRRSTILGATALAMGIPSHFVGFINSFPMLMAYSVILGLFQGVYPAYYAVIIVDYLKLENLKSTLGYSILMHGFFVSAGFPIIGILRDVTGTYVTSYHYLGVALNLAALLAFSLPAVEKWNKKRNSQDDGL